ncbi:hypothetical protein [Micrococcus sp.]|uniref:hypothetical protein n=1 Tax=Micrococcus sp. TaxID=1271 RepID=UPI002A9163B8|nr:hypothetical protein [Micrococcus sp.]MDY6055876.1 hypothetical protein [Micrococcus sp.]
MTSPHRPDDDVAPTTQTPRTTTNPHRDARSRWGRSARLGGGTGRLIAVSLLLGTLLAALVGVVTYALATLQGHADPAHPRLLGLLLAASTLLPAAALVWALLVDRGTVRGAVRDPEESVENRWYEKATSGAFHDLLVLLGLGSVAVAVADWEIPTRAVGVTLILFMAASVAVRYLLLKRRG